MVEKPDNKKNRFQISLAIPDSNNAIPGWLFCYFPTEVDVPLPLLVHATVELDETRKHVINSLANQYILKTVAERIAELAEQQLNREGADPWDGCESACNNDPLLAVIGIEN